MPRPKNSTFNTTGFSAKHPAFMGYSLLSTSPFRSDGEAWTGGAKEITADTSDPTMGFVYGPQKFDKQGNPLRRAKFRIRIACEHWATDKKASDCRYGCEAKAQLAAFVP